ncbi:T-complex protein 11 [Tanacetum coccineum]
MFGGRCFWLDVLEVRLGLLKLVNNVNGVTQELPETIKLNFHRLRSVQDQLQKITGLEELVVVLSKAVEAFDTANHSTKSQSRRLVMERMLRKSVQAGDPIFVKVSRAVYLATRGVVLGGSGTKGRELAVKALRQGKWVLQF